MPVTSVASVPARRPGHAAGETDVPGLVMVCSGEKLIQDDCFQEA